MANPGASAALIGLLLAGGGRAAQAQFRDDFTSGPLPRDPSALSGWAFFTGDGRATMDFRQEHEAYASIFVDASADRRGIWWALVKRKVSDGLDLAALGRPGTALRVEARLRVSEAPRRVNLHLNTQRTTDFHSHLMEFDIPVADRWHTISMTTRGFDAVPGDRVFGQLALIDWGLGRYRVDLDYFKVDVVEVARAGPDLGEPIPYHPPIPDPALFRQALPVAHDATVDLDSPDVNLNNWTVRGTRARRLVAFGGTRYAIFRFDLSTWRGRQASGAGLFEVTTHTVETTSDAIKDFGVARVVEILRGDPGWDQTTVTLDGLRRGEALERVLNTQMIIDWPVSPGDGAKTYFTIPRPVLQRLLDGTTHGLAIKPLGAIHASLYAMEEGPGRTARLLFNVTE
jgi:hypothetical protein